MSPSARAPFNIVDFLEAAAALSSHVSTQDVRKAAPKKGRKGKQLPNTITHSFLAYSRLLL